MISSLEVGSVFKIVDEARSNFTGCGDQRARLNSKCFHVCGIIDHQQHFALAGHNGG